MSSKEHTVRLLPQSQELSSRRFAIWRRHLRWFAGVYPVRFWRWRPDHSVLAGGYDCPDWGIPTGRGLHV